MYNNKDLLYCTGEPNGLLGLHDFMAITVYNTFYFISDNILRKLS
jgi:hypothetical protein